MTVNISFIVIARNEELVIKSTLDALSNIALKVDNVEVILVDSNSSDNTLAIMKDISKSITCPSKVIVCSGDLNAAVVRNIGFKNSYGKFAFFVDGDTEINIDFVEKALELFDNDHNLVGVTGQLSDYMYSDDFASLLEVLKDRNGISKQQAVSKFGGNVIVRSDALRAQGAWDEDFTVNEDTELAIRLAVYGKVVAIPYLIGNHHTKRSEIYNRSYLELQRGRHRYYGQLLRKNITSFKSASMLLKCNQGHAVGLMYYLLIVFSVILSFNFKISYLIPFFSLIFADFMIGFIKKKPLVDRFITRVIAPAIVIKGFIFPIKKKRVINAVLVEENNCNSK
ncbi:membrane hypothetical protein [Vibrio chagasii]|nr:membrane hypothetical protein [Vibrio chagasii]